MANSLGNSVFTLKVTCTTSDQKLDMLGSRNEIVLVSDADCFINFDQEVDVDERFLLKANVPVRFSDIMVRTMHYLGASGGENIYVMSWKSVQ